MQAVIEFAKIFNAHVDVVWMSTDASLDVDSILDRWKQIFGSDVSFRILSCRNPEEAIFDYVSAHRIDLVAMTVKHKGFLEKLLFKSMAVELAFHSTMPILAITTG